MRNLKNFLLLSMFVILFSSCGKNKDVNPDYIGTWVSMQSMATTTGFVQVKDMMTFTKDGFTDIAQIYDATTASYISFIEMDGTLSITGTTMNVTITAMGVSSIDAISGQFTGTIITYKDGTSQFSSLLTQSGQPKTFKSDYSVLGNTLTLKTDNNSDGVITADETTVYSKQE